MELHPRKAGAIAKLTPSEASSVVSWAKTSHDRQLDGSRRANVQLAQRINTARLVAKPFKNVPKEAKSAFECLDTVNWLMERIQYEFSERREALNEQGAERHTIEVALSDDELYFLDREAQLHIEISEPMAKDTEATMREAKKQYSATYGDLDEPEELQQPQDEEDERWMVAHNFEEHFKQLQIATGMRAAIKAYLDGPQ